MVDSIFPPKDESFDFTDREWETYCCQVWCNNSLNATEGYLRHLGNRVLSNEQYVPVKKGVAINIADQLRKAQMVINYLLKDSGRLEEGE